MSPAYAHRALQGKPPWPSAGSPEVPQEQSAGRQDVTFTCERCGPFVVPLAAIAEVPDTWECRRCSTPALRDGAPAGAARDARTPGYATTGKYERDREAKTPWDHLRERRKVAELEEILAESLATIRQNGVAR